MSFKYTGRLIGTTSAQNFLSTTTEPDRRNPAFTHSAYTKLLGYGEPGVGDAFNRAFLALSTNTDSLAGVLDTPCLRSEFLHYYADANTGHVGSGKFGFPALAITDPEAIKSGNYPEVNLGIQDASNTSEPPAVWVYCGLHRTGLQEGRYMRLYRDSREKPNKAASSDLSRRAQFSHSIAPDYVKPRAGAAIWYPTQEYIGDSPQSLTDWVPGITQVESDIPPYKGSTASLTIASWEEDGPVLQSVYWYQYYMRPGCFVWVTGSTANNNGLWRVAKTAGKKAVLTRGGLAKVTLTGGGGASFAAGKLVSWPAAPNETSSGKKIDQRHHRAYVAYVDVDTLWLCDFHGYEDWSVDDVASGTARGSKVAHNISTGDGAAYHNTYSMGDFGLADQETGATTNWLMPVGTRLYPEDYSSIGSTTSVATTAFVPPAYPHKFDVTGAAGTATPCGPMGFLLNPVLGLPDASSDPHPTMAGKYFLECKTLTTVKERLLEGGAVGDASSTDDPTSVMDGHDKDKHHWAHKALLDYVHRGHQTLSTWDVTLNDWHTPTRTILGPATWLIVATKAGGEPNGIGDKFEDGTGGGSGELLADDRITFTHPDGGGATATGTIVTGWDDYLVLQNVQRDGTWTAANELNYTTKLSIAVGSTVLNDGNTYTVSAVYHPKIKTGTGATETEAPTLDLNSAYHRMLSGDYYERNRGLGNQIQITDDRPLTLVGTATAGKTLLQVITDANTNSVFAAAKTDSTNILEIRTNTSDDAPRFATGANKFFLTNEPAGTDDAALKPGSGNFQLFSSGDLFEFRTWADLQGLLVDVSNIGLRSGTDRIQFQLKDSPYTNIGEIDVTSSEFGFRDTNLTGKVNLSNSGVLDIDSSYQNKSIVGGLNDNVITRLLTGVVEGFEVSDGGGTTVQIEAGTIVYKGVKHVLTSQFTHAAAAAETRYYWWDTSTKNVGHDTTIPDVGSNQHEAKILLAAVTTVASDITMLSDLRNVIGRMDIPSEFTVGTSADDEFRHIPNFETLSHAFSVINAWAVLPSGAETDYPFNFKLHVIGPVAEAQTFAMKVPVNGLVIEGHNDASITWAGTEATEQSLFDLDDKTNFVLKNLRFVSQATAPNHDAVPALKGSDPVVNLITNNGTSGGGSFTIKDCYVSGVSAVAFFADSSKGYIKSAHFENIVAESVTNCFAAFDDPTGATDHGKVVMRNCKCEIKYDYVAAPTDWRATNYRKCVELQHVEDQYIEGCNFYGSTTDDDMSGGIASNDALDGRCFILNNRIDMFEGATAYGIDIQSSTGQGWVVQGNTISNQTGATAAGIYVNADTGTVGNNTFIGYSAGEVAIEAPSNAARVSIEGNATDGGNIVTNGAEVSISDNTTGSSSAGADIKATGEFTTITSNSTGGGDIICEEEFCTIMSNVTRGGEIKLHASGGHTVIMGNNLLATTTTGDTIDSVGADYCTIIGNIVKGALKNTGGSSSVANNIIK